MPQPHHLRAGRVDTPRHRLDPTVHQPARRRTGAVRGGIVAAVVASALGGGLVAVSSASAAATNLVVNSTFATSTSGWFASSPATLSLGPTRSGTTGYSAAVRNSATSARTVALNDSRNTVGSTVKGATYTASAWVRSDRANVSLGVRMMEYAGRTLLGQAKASAWVTDTGWHQVKVSYVAKRNGATIDLNALAWSLSSGGRFYVDDVWLVRGTSVPSTSTTTSTPTTTTTTTAPATTTTTTAAPTTSTTTSATSTSTTTTAPATTTTTAAAPTGWHLAWSDEFNGSAVDTSRWNVRNNDYASNELSIVTNRSKNVSVANGVLSLTAQREQYSTGSTTRSYTSGYLDSIGKFSQRYGRWEMRASLPASKGLWPAFWLRSNTDLPELDIMEAVGGVGTTVHTIHQSTNGDEAKSGYEYTFPAGETPQGWHVYAVEWEPTAVRFYVDGVMIRQRTSADLPWLATDFVTPMNIRLNLQVGGSMPSWYGKNVDSTTVFPATFAVDYVRVYQR
jgi:beta-glucanase (GH16 family)